MSPHAEHISIEAIGYGVFMYFVSSYCLRLIFRDAFQALEQSKRHIPVRGSMIFNLVVVLSVPIFIFGMLFTH